MRQGVKIMLTYNQAAAQVMYHLVEDPSHGYSQYSRQGNGSTETLYIDNFGQVEISYGDRDCSSAIDDCYISVKLILDDDRTMWTGNEEEILTRNGFVEIPIDQNLQEGDVLWNNGHTEMIISVDGHLYQAGFRRSETNSIDGQEGDQDGYESTYSEINYNQWRKAFRYVGIQLDDIIAQQKEKELEEARAKIAEIQENIDKLKEETSEYEVNSIESMKNSFIVKEENNNLAHKLNLG